MFYFFFLTLCIHLKAKSMKRRLLTILFLLALLSTTASTLVGEAVDSSRRKAPHVTDYKAFVVEGRTWWYYNWGNGMTKGYEFGVRIGEAEEIDGVEWNRIEVGLREIFGSYGSEGKVFEADPILCGYIREEAKKVYVRHYSNNEGFRGLGASSFGGQLNYLGIDDYIDCLVYDFSPSGTKTFYGSQKYNWEAYTIDHVTTTVSNGISYNRYVCSCDREENTNDALIYPIDFDYLEAIGYDKGVFYSPFSRDEFSAIGAFPQPTLRYVTDAENKVIYEGVGGKRLWQYYEDTVHNANYQALVVEGRTWWYHNANEAGKSCEFGVSIGKAEEIDGTMWNRIEVGLREMRLSGESGEGVIETEPILAGYIREKDKKVYVRYSIGVSDFDGLGTTSYGGQMKYLLEHEYIDGLVYSYTLAGTENFYGAIQNKFQVYTVNAITSVAGANGRVFNSYSCTADAGSGRDDLLELPTEFAFLDGIGYEGGLFYSPFSDDEPATADSFGQPTLRYVTDADGTVIYESAGGKQLWEYAGVENVRVSEDELWFNLQGMPVAKPTAPGVYIRKKGNEIIKTAVR